MGLSPTGAFVGRVAGRCACHQHADIDLGRAAPGGSDVSGLGRTRCSATACSAGSCAASAAGRGRAASSASGSHAASAAAAARSRAAAARACLAGRPCCPGRSTRSTTSVVGSARRRAARVGPSGRSGTCLVSGRTRAGVGRARRAASGRTPVELMGGARRACSLDRLAFT